MSASACTLDEFGLMALVFLGFGFILALLFTITGPPSIPSVMMGRYRQWRTMNRLRAEWIAMGFPDDVAQQRAHDAMMKEALNTERSMEEITR